MTIYWLDVVESTGQVTITTDTRRSADLIRQGVTQPYRWVEYVPPRLTGAVGLTRRHGAHLVWETGGPAPPVELVDAFCDAMHEYHGPAAARQVRAARQTGQPVDEILWTGYLYNTLYLAALIALIPLGRRTWRAFKAIPPRHRPGVCDHCGYDTSGLKTNVCPECGHANVARVY